MEVQNALYWVERLKMLPHPEGGYYCEHFRSQQQVTRANTSVTRSACTSIHYLLEGCDFSGFHRLLSDEIWYFHTGAPLYVHVITSDGEYSLNELSFSGSGSLTLTVPAGCWFASEIPSKTGFSLVSCAVAPGFEFSEFEMGAKDDLSVKFPKYPGLFKKLCRL